ncbi:MAG: ATP-grasp domain-containing protein [Acidimicrobiales bacterium]|nr:ATP-grasp domain-containing protein [Acidimicrobiales bacterium]MYG88069.1 ATP-grasp domain-containing protein [Acidimicrobiales bacterium]MYI27348.1 ATP-grasp domain-containing protein [Acidimicrobiales bacterium]
MSFTRVLIANRGEIAIRIAKAADALGIETVAVHAPVDERSLHLVAADQIAPLPGGDPLAAYLNIDALLRIAAEHGCDCVHPGYGFLAENAAFAAGCAEAGLTFVGPAAGTLELFGDKVRARTLAASLEIPVAGGSPGAVADAAAAADAAAEVGLPVMLKAAAGGGGRGMRAVERIEDIAEAFERCSSEAAAAFGNDAVFVERLVERPRHIEVQVLADLHGSVAHLWERDCSVQQRNQKVIEIAPAPGLDAGLRDRLHADAVRLAAQAGLANAATVEFLVSPEAGDHFFIECNPRIQVEHTVTEQVTGVDLVEAQFRIAAGARLEEIGVVPGDADRGRAAAASVAAPRGYAVQARVVATGSGAISAYHEPSGAGVRVDAAGYAGYTPPPHYDPLLAKVIGTGSTLEAAAARTSAALADFHIGQLPTNIDQLRQILNHPAVRSGDARTTLLAEMVPPADGAAAVTSTNGMSGDMSGSASRRAAMLESASAAPPVTVPPVTAAASTWPDRELADGEVAIRSPLPASVVEMRVNAGDAVAAGQALVVLSAMKMETEVTAPCDGTVSALRDLQPGDQLAAGDVLAVVLSGADAGGAPITGTAPSGWEPLLDDVQTLQRLAEERLGPDSDEPGVVRQRNRGKLHCRDRIRLLLDDGSFREVGSLAGFASYDDEGEIAAFTPANHVGGTGKINSRDVIVCADDFTSRGGHADGAIGAKSFYLDLLSTELGVPSIRLLDGSSGGGSVASMVPEQRKEGESSAKESTGAIKAGRPRVTGGGGSFLPSHLGSTEYAEQLATVPVVNMLLGSVVGIGAAKAVLGHFAVMVRDISQLFVAGPPVVSHAMGYDISKEDLGDWRIHCTNGSVDNLAETEEEAAELVRRFLSYLPSSVYETPPVLPPAADDPPDRRDEELLTLIPRKRTTTFDIRRGIELICDRGSFFEIGPLWGTDQVVGFARMNGHPVGVLASDSRHPNGGALTADGCDKLTRHIDLCDLFHMPILNLCDNPGFAVGVEHEITGTIRKGATWMTAFAQAAVPIFTVLMRRSFGVAGNNYATPRRQHNARVVWPAADVGGIPPEGGIEAAYKRQLAEAEDPVALRAELEARIEAARGPIGPLNRFQIEEMVDPRDTRRLICEWIEGANRVVNRPAQLVPRPIAYRP